MSRQRVALHIGQTQATLSSRLSGRAIVNGPRNRAAPFQHAKSQSTLILGRTRSRYTTKSLARSIGNRHDSSYSVSEDTRIRNPLDYVHNEQKVKQRMSILRRRVFAGCAVLALLTGAQVLIVFTTDDSKSTNQEEAQRKKKPWISEERLDAAPNSGQPGEIVVVQTKPGQPEVKLDEKGIELVETGTSTIPHFPRKIQIPTSNADPAAAPADARLNEEEYYLLGTGVRKVSWFGVEVYVLGLYVRTSDLPALQLAFVKHINPIGTSLISNEKDTLKGKLLDDAASMELWDKVLQETDIRSAVRIVPTKGTDFAHLRDGWVRGITARTQAAAKEGSKAYDDDEFGTSMSQFKALFGGKGKAPVGSVVLLTRDEKGKLGVLYSDKKTRDSPAAVTSMGALADERISRQVWLGYLGGKNVSSEAARKSIVDGVMELVERPVGTVGKAIL